MTRTNMRPTLQAVLSEANELPAEELPRLLGDLEEIRSTALARLLSPAPPAQEDLWLDVATAAHKLGMSTDYLYRHHTKFSFTRREGNRLLFSRNGMEKYMKTAKDQMRSEHPIGIGGRGHAETEREC